MLPAGPDALRRNTTRLLAEAFGAGIVAFLLGLCLVLAVKRFDNRVFAGIIVSAAALVLVLLWTRRAVGRLATSETAKKSARQFLHSCLFFSPVCATFGFAVAGAVWNSWGSLQAIGAVFYGGIVCAGIYCVFRDTKRLTSTLG